ncbi:hypothetical protein [Acinetobacter sp. YH12206]|nr:hypothetical protein [Acinetobacter sp. YH12206]
MLQQIVQQSQFPWSFETQIIHFKHIQLDEYPNDQNAMRFLFITL